ncbi:MAG: hypothetical protein OXF63_07035 [Anaerolineaceae bacterium]|nr:hypothetical protein [Anaerolineaceae bacterium]
MKTDRKRFILSSILFLLLTTSGNALAQDTNATPVPKTPLPVPQSPAVTLESNVVNNVETGDFVVTSSNASQFANAESVEWVAAIEARRTDAEGAVSPSAAGSIRVSAEDLEYEDGDIVSFSLTSLAALDDATYSDSPSLIFCYPVHESCLDPRTLVRSLPPPVDATISLAAPEPPADSDAQAQVSDGGGTFEVTVPKRGTVINNADGYSWQAENSDGNSASGQENLGGSDAQAQAVDPVETIRFGADLIDYQPDEALRLILRTVAPTGSNLYVDSHPVVYYFCTDPNVNCAGLWSSSAPGGNGGDGGGGGGPSGNCLNTDEAAPIKVCANADYSSYTLYGVYQDSSVQSLSSVTSASSLCGDKAEADDNLASGINVAANKAYTVSYDGDCTMTLSTYYADKGPDVDKPYVITIDEHHTVRYLQW